MDNLKASYEDLKSLAINAPSYNVDIRDSLKIFYKDIINSNRYLTQIQDIASLIKVLEKLDYISPLNVDGFGYIYSALHLSPRVLEDHKNLIHVHGPRFNDCYENEIQNESSPVDTTRAIQYTNQNRFGPQRLHKAELSDRVLKTVCSQIGNSWKSMARYLKVIQECQIEAIEANRRLSNEDRARMVLEEYQRNAIPSDIKPKLLKALILVKRMDLHKEVERLFYYENQL